MSAANKKYIAFSVLDFLFTFGGSGAVIVYNYCVPDNSNGYKITLTGIILFIAMIFTAKAIFEKSYRDKLDTLLQQLAEATDADVKKVISAKINAHKIKNTIYQRIMLLLPFIVLVFVTTVAIKWLEELQTSAGLILASLGAGSVFNVLKSPAGDKAKMEKYKKKAKKG